MRASEASFADHWGHTPQPFDDVAGVRRHAVDDFDPSLWFARRGTATRSPVVR